MCVLTNGSCEIVCFLTNGCCDIVCVLFSQSFFSLCRGRCAFLFRKKRQIQKKIETFKRSNRVVTTELAVFSPLIVENQQASLSEDNERDWEEKPKDEEQHEGELKEKKVSSSGSIINATITCSDL